MHLVLRDGIVPVVQMGPDFLLVDQAYDQPPCEASLVLRVDQSESRWLVLLPEGLSAQTNRVAIAKVAA